MNAWLNGAAEPLLRPSVVESCVDPVTLANDNKVAKGDREDALLRERSLRYVAASRSRYEFVVV